MQTESTELECYLILTYNICIQIGEKNHQINMSQLAALPSRIRGDYLKGKKKINLVTNLYKVNFNSNHNLVVYSVKIQPYIQYDNRSLKDKVFSIAVQKLSGDIKKHVISGNSIYAIEKKDGNPLPQETFLQARVDDINYKLSFKRVKTVDFSKINSSNKREAIFPISFMNNLIKNFLQQLQYCEIGKSRKYFTEKNHRTMDNIGVTLFNGFATSINNLQNGIYLRVDSATRIVQNKTALAEIDHIMQINQSKSKDQKRQLIKEQFCGSVVMAKYGNHKYWRIEDVVFDLNCSEYVINTTTNLTIIQYYKTKYNLNITKPKQPLFQAKLNQTNKRGKNLENKQEDDKVLLIPEFVLMSGLPDDFDERKRRQISEHTILKPTQKSKRIQSLIDSFYQELRDFGPAALSEVLGLRIERKPESIEAINLGSPYLALGQNRSVEQGKVAFFNLFKDPLFKSNIELNMLVIASSGVDFKQISQLVQSTCKNIKVLQKLKKVEINYNDQRKAMVDIQSFIQDRDSKYKQFNCFWFIIPNNFKKNYSQIKRLSLIQARNPRITQVCVESLLQKKNFSSIVTKILLQMCAKVGNILWAPRPPSKLPKNVMMIGIDNAKDKVSKGTVITFCATISSDFGKFYSNYTIQKTQEGLKIQQVMLQALNAFAKENKSPPSEVIILKNGCGDSQIDMAKTNEINQIEIAISKISQQSQKPKLSYIIVDKNVSQKLFNFRGSQANNPSFGMLINEQIVSKDYDFYMISQHCNMGTVKPVYYKIIHSTSKIEEGILQELIYSQCFNYANWTGSVRVPGVLQYAKKLSMLISQYVNQVSRSSNLEQNLYFI